jgi:hypothetical protein
VPVDAQLGRRGGLEVPREGERLAHHAPPRTRSP